jgi:hypothetical protein
MAAKKAAKKAVPRAKSNEPTYGEIVDAVRKAGKPYPGQRADAARLGRRNFIENWATEVMSGEITVGKERVRFSGNQSPDNARFQRALTKVGGEIYDRLRPNVGMKKPAKKKTK